MKTAKAEKAIKATKAAKLWERCTMTEKREECTVTEEREKCTGTGTKVWEVPFIADAQNSGGLWESIPFLVIDEFPWDENGYRPRAETRIFYTETCFSLQFRAYEQEIRAECLNMNDRVCTDSCVEFFFNPDPGSDIGYMNFEINPIGTLLLGIGRDRYTRTLVSNVSPAVLNIATSVTPESRKDYKGPFWVVEYAIPFSFIERYYGKLHFQPGKRMKGNFYKCGDKTRFPHYGCWNRIDNPVPDFHRPEFFGDLILG
jgi:hypothetical protein